MRRLVPLLVPLLLAGCAGDPEDQADQAGHAGQSPASSSPSSSSPTLPAPSRDTTQRPGAIGVPHEDEGVARTGEVATRTSVCVDDADPRWAFDGTVTAIDDGEVTFTVHESFSGELPATYVVEMGAPVKRGGSETGPSYSVGTRMLVSGAGDAAWGCGATVYFDEESASAWRS